MKDFFKHHDWQRLRRYLLIFARNPLEKIKHVPSFDWPHLIFFIGALAAMSISLNGIVGQYFNFNMILGVLLFPIASIVVTLILSGFFYYTFLFFLDKKIDFKYLVTVLFFSTIPYYIFEVAEPAFKVARIVGLLFTSVLIIVGLVENFKLNKRFITRLVGAAVVVYFVLWGLSLLNENQSRIQQQDFENYHLDQLEREVKDSQ